MGVEYRLEHPERSDCCGIGYQLFDKDVYQGFPTLVKDRLFDTEGTEILVDLLQDLSNAEFDPAYLQELFSLEPQTDLIKEWRIGEVISELILEGNHQIRFHHNAVRDAKNPLANQTGTDIIGFRGNNHETCFVFGEVKTTPKDRKSPPSVMYPMERQLENLVNTDHVAKNLIRYLGFKVIDLPTEDQFRIDYRLALVSFRRNKYLLYGCLVRDTKPNPNDLKARLNSLVGKLSAPVILSLIAIYVPLPAHEWVELVEGGEQHEN